jgi:23S rRNA pseudouridine955/2504/2580 synthase
MSSDKSEPPGKVRMALIDQHSQGQRIDNYLLTQLKGVPRSHIYRLLRSGQVRVNKGRIKPPYRLQLGDEVRIPPVRVSERPDSSVPTAVLKLLAAATLFENEDLLVIDKPAGIPVHAGSGIHYGVAEAFKQMYPGQFIELVHRLDRDTSGCLLLAKNRGSLGQLHTMMREASGIEKQYLALVAGHWPGTETVDVPLEKIQRSGERMVEAREGGASARSHFEARKLYRDVSLMKVQIDTGRTHQIRVHASVRGHPLAGDSKYGDDSFNKQMKALGLKRLFLHACRLSFKLNKKNIQVEAPLPAELKNLLARLEET